MNGESVNHNVTLKYALWGIIFTAVGCSSSQTGHGSDPVAQVLAALVVILAMGKLGGELCERLGQPAVLGELVGGMALGNLVLFVPDLIFFEPLRVASIQQPWAVVISAMAQLGVIILLFEVGLESTVQGMLKVGATSLGVALVGVIAPFLLGFGVSWLFIRELPVSLAAIPEGFSPYHVHMFVGTVLSATSVGITARVFKDLGRLKSVEAQIILGAAVLDDVIGLIALAVVSAVITAATVGQPVELLDLLQLGGVAVGFLFGSLLLGAYLVPKILPRLATLRTSGMMLTSALLLAFGLSYLAHLAGLAPIVGAFAAGLILEQVHFRSFREEITIEELLKPVATFLVPIFFVLMGIQVRLETFADFSVLGLALGLTVVAIIGKLACGLAVFRKRADRLTVGIGMIPRGEVGLIFASVGRGLGVIDDGTFSAIVIMVMTTTLITPPLLKYAFSREKKTDTAP